MRQLGLAFTFFGSTMPGGRWFRVAFRLLSALLIVVVVFLPLWRLLLLLWLLLRLLVVRLLLLCMHLVLVSGGDGPDELVDIDGTV